MAANRLEFSPQVRAGEFYAELAQTRLYDELTIGSAAEFGDRLRQAVKLGEGTSTLVWRLASDRDGHDATGAMPIDQGKSLFDEEITAKEVA